MATYRAYNLKVTPLESQYGSDESVIVKIECDFERKNGMPGAALWAGDIYHTSISRANLIDSQEFARAPWTTIDTGHYENTIQFRPPASGHPVGTLAKKILVAAHDIG